MRCPQGGRFVWGNRFKIPRWRNLCASLESFGLEVLNVIENALFNNHHNSKTNCLGAWLKISCESLVSGYKSNNSIWLKFASSEFFNLILHKQFMQSNILERMNAQNLQSSVEASEQFQLLVQYGYQQICLVMNQIENLRENKANGYHPCSIASAVPKNSNPSHPFSCSCL